MSRISSNECGILNSTFFDLQSQGILLMLKFLPYQIKFPLVDESFPKKPDGGVIRYLFEEIQEISGTRSCHLPVVQVRGPIIHTSIEGPVT
jgi:hypothetical protein